MKQTIATNFAIFRDKKAPFHSSNLAPLPLAKIYCEKE